jgi:hypothetical protein
VYEYTNTYIHLYVGVMASADAMMAGLNAPTLTTTPTLTNAITTAFIQTLTYTPSLTPTLTLVLTLTSIPILTPNPYPPPLGVVASADAMIDGLDAAYLAEKCLNE